MRFRAKYAVEITFNSTFDFELDGKGGRFFTEDFDNHLSAVKEAFEKTASIAGVGLENVEVKITQIPTPHNPDAPERGAP